MVGWLFWKDERRLHPRLEPRRVLDLPLAAVALPRGNPARRLRQGARILRRMSVRRALASADFTGWDILRAEGIFPVDPLPLCRAEGAELALTLLREYPPRLRTVALRGDVAGPEARRLACILCPQVGTLLLDLGRGEEELADELRGRYGAVPLHWGQGPLPQVTLELSSVQPGPGRVIRLWGEPELAGLTLTLPEAELPPELDPLPLLELLWETGRVGQKEITVVPSPP